MNKDTLYVCVRVACEEINKSMQHSKWFEPRSISSSYSVIVGVSLVLKRTVFGD